ncbi:MAG: chemotaxis protein CheV [Alcaligenaceae bacterium]|nr:chemotaxis protein CheV [Alcaligenaceae bacterium]
MSTSNHAGYFDSVHETTNLAGSNKLELLVFELYDEKTDSYQSYGINVFKVREVMKTPDLTSLPNSENTGVVGMLRLRGQVVSMIDLPFFMGSEQKGHRDCLIITEYNNNVQGFLVDRIDNIVRLDWNLIKPAPQIMNSNLITSIAEVEDKLVMIVDVETIMSRINPAEHDEEFKAVDTVKYKKQPLVYFAEDSKTAQGLIVSTLNKMGVPYRSSENGRDAYEKLMAMADQYGKDLKNHLTVILTDIEMPEMDGFTLTKLIREDKRFDGIPVLIQSSLSGESNREFGKKVRADGYIDKFNPVKLAEEINKYLE